MGVSMAMTLYDPVFTVLTRRYADRYREGITALTLVGGFASTLSFPAAAWLIERLEWRPALQVIGAVLLFGAAPLHAWALRGSPPVGAGRRTRSAWRCWPDCRCRWRSSRSPIAALLVFALLFGLANGLMTIVRGSIVALYFGRGQVGRISGTMSAIALLARAGAPLGTAWLLVALGGYRAMLLVLAGSGALALLAFALAGRPDSKAPALNSA